MIIKLWQYNQYMEILKRIDNLLQNAYNGDNEVIGFKLVFPVENSLLEAGTIYNINSSSSMKTALASNSGTATGVKSFLVKSCHWIFKNKCSR